MSLAMKNANLVVLHHADHALPIGSVEVGTGVAVIHEKLDIAKTLVLCEPFEDSSLIYNAVALTCLLIVTT